MASEEPEPDEAGTETVGVRNAPTLNQSSKRCTKIVVLRVQPLEPDRMTKGRT
jgi:hypothetical protein